MCTTCLIGISYHLARAREVDPVLGVEAGKILLERSVANFPEILTPAHYKTTIGAQTVGGSLDYDVGSWGTYIWLGYRQQYSTWTVA